ncbi:uncharacterized protein [Diadema antillarum]|uniref:uncharacterized protein n=1 Tax=Diadema antillarum TaxID=105358 RepID=UPI003A89EF4A
MQRLTNYVQGYQRVGLELKQADVQKALVKAIKDMQLKKRSAAAASTATQTSGIQDRHGDVVQGVQRQIHTGQRRESCGNSGFGEAYEPWSDDMACILQGSCMPGSTRYCRTASMFSKMELQDIMQSTGRNGLLNGKRYYHTATRTLPIWSLRNSRLASPAPLAGLVGVNRYATDTQEGKEEGGAAEGQVSQRAKLKRAVRDYGSTVVVFHVCISLMSLGGFYLAVSSGVDVQSLLSALGFSKDVIESKIATGTSTFVMAYAVHKVFAPVRIGITLTCTPFIVRYLRGVGLLKRPIPSK